MRELRFTKAWRYRLINVRSISLFLQELNVEQKLYAYLWIPDKCKWIHLYFY